MKHKSPFSAIEKVIISFMVVGCIFWGVAGYAVYSYLNK